MKNIFMVMALILVGCAHHTQETRTQTKMADMRISLEFKEFSDYREPYCISIKGESQEKVQCDSLGNLERERFWGNWGKGLCLQIDIHPEKSNEGISEEVCFMEEGYQELGIIFEEGQLKFCSEKDSRGYKYTPEIPTCPYA
jgi:hypothetical protein